MTIRILAFNTSSELCSVSIMIDQNIYNDRLMTYSNHHSENILPMINRLLVKLGMTLKSLDYIIFSYGPGSFIGIRTGICVAQGLSLGVDVPAIALSSLEILAQGAWRLFSASQVITTIDARMQSIYWGRYYRKDHSCWIMMDNDSLLTEIEIKKTVKLLKDKCVLVGTGWNYYPILSYISMHDPIILRSIMFPEAQDMLPLGIYRWKRGIFLTPDQIKPIYLRNNVAVKKHRSL